LLSAVQMGQVGQMLNQNNFLGGLGNLEGAFLIGIASIIYSFGDRGDSVLLQSELSVAMWGLPRSHWLEQAATCGNSWNCRWAKVRPQDLPAAGAGGAQSAGAGSSASTAASFGPANSRFDWLEPAGAATVATGVYIEFRCRSTDDRRPCRPDSQFIYRRDGSGSSDTQPESEAAETAVPTQVTGATSGGSSSSREHPRRPGVGRPSTVTTSEHGAHTTRPRGGSGFGKRVRRAKEKE